MSGPGAVPAVPSVPAASSGGHDAVLGAERAELERAGDCLAEMREQARSTVGGAVDRLTAQALATARQRRLEAIDAGLDAPPFFARFDLDPTTARPGGETFHLGRLHVRDAAGDPVVIDWRVPIARAFYQATPAERMGVRLRRRFGFAGGVLTSYEDEHLEAGEDLGTASDVLRQEIERPRRGPMRDIVATIQPDQDDLVRADLDRSLCVQGAPGTGKTAVGLHRAAYLLYTYPDRLRRTGVLVVGPNPAFLRYTAQVLPSLGEAGIEQTTVHQLVASSRPAAAAGRRPAREDDALAALKGDARLAEVLRRALQRHTRPVLGSLLLPVGARRFRIDAARLEVFRQEALTGGRRWNAARDRLAHRLAGEVRRGIEDAGGAMTDRQLTQLTRSAPVREFLDAVWPALDADRVLLRLYTDAAFRAGCGAGLLSPAEQQALAWTSTPRSARSAPWTHADLVLLDELAGLIAGPATYVHLVVDEAQDLSAMQCRAVGRRAPRGSVTVLGDQAQATTPWATGSWKETMQHLGHPDADVVPLTAGYRVPMPVLELANRLLPHIAPEVPPATSIRSGERALSYAPANRLTEVVAREAAREGSLAIIGPDDRVAHLLGRLRGAGVDAVALADEAPSARAVVVPAGLAKGLEYDSVVLVEPAAVVASAPTRAGGLRLLYVTLTRAVSHLVVVHDRPLPAELA